MANRFPLIVDSSAQRIKELPTGDNLDLTGSGISAVRNIIPETDATYSIGDGSSSFDVYANDVTIGGSVTAGGGTGTNGQFLQSTGTGVTWATVESTFGLAADSGAQDTFSTGGVLTFSGTSPISTTVSDDTVTIAAANATTESKGVASFNSSFFTVTGAQVSLADSGVSANTYGSATAVPVITVNSAGQITSVSTSNISTTLTVGDGSATDTVTLGTDTLVFAAGSGITTDVTDNTVTIAASGGFADSTVLAFPSGDYGDGEDAVGGADTTDAFGVAVGTLFSCMEPVGSLVAEDLGAFS